MTWRTHLLAGIGGVWLLTPVPGLVTSTNVGLLAMVAGTAALLPDLDAAESKLKHLALGGIEPLNPLSGLIHRAFGHRGMFHSLAALAGVGAIASFLVGSWGVGPSLAVVAGYASHLALDACTKTGIPLFWPNLRRYWLLPRALRVTTGSTAEDLLLPLLAEVVMFLLLLRLPHW